MKTVAIERMSSLNSASIAEHFETGPAFPCILTDAVSEWPALDKWSIDFFASNYSEEFGVASISFENSTSGKMTKLGSFIDNLDKPFSEIPGYWIVDGQPLLADPEIDETLVWSFSWQPFKKHPELLDDISPFPPCIPNITAHLPADISNILEYVYGLDFYSIFLSRKNVIVPLHIDFHHTIACLVQFEGDKTVHLFAPDDYQKADGANFDPENPDFGLFPEMRDRAMYSSVLAPGEMLIIPPRWWHYTRNEDHSLTLSHNFFNHTNFAPCIRRVFEDMCAREDKQALCDRIGEFLHSGGGEGSP